jgi:hypothetical protein
VSLPGDESLGRVMLGDVLETAKAGNVPCLQAVMLFQAIVVVASALAAPGASPSSDGIPTYLVPVDDSVLGKEFTAAQVETRLRDRLARRSALRLVDEPTRGGMRVQVTGCARVQETAARRDPERHPPVTLPPGGRGKGTIITKDEEIGVSVENRTFVILAVRVTWQDETREIASGEDELTLEAAASTVAREIEKLVKRKPRRSAP